MLEPRPTRGGNENHNGSLIGMNYSRGGMRNNSGSLFEITLMVV